jgi:hypothetical protein
MNQFTFFITFCLTSFYISFTELPPKYMIPPGNPQSSRFGKHIFCLQNKIYLDLKFKATEPIRITKDNSSLSIDLEGKIIGYKDVYFRNNYHLITVPPNNHLLRNSTLWGIMKFIKI